MASIDLHLTRAESGIPTIIWIEEAAETPAEQTRDEQSIRYSAQIDEAGALLDVLILALPSGTLKALGVHMVARGLVPIDTTP